VTKEVTILGGGIAGISAAYHARLKGINATVYEAKPRLGGLVDNFVIDGFRFDNAIHLSFTKDPYVRAMFDKTEYLTHPATSYCYDERRWLKHPAQNNLYPLPVDDKVRLLLGFMDRPRDAVVFDYKDWLISQYGRDIALRYPLPYTEKYWTVPADRLGVEWIANRMRKADATEVLRGALVGDTPNTYYADEMRYPKCGGYRAFVEPMIAEVSALCDKKVVEVDLSAKRVAFADGTTVYYEQLVNTLPLPVFAAMCTDLPGDIKAAAALLWATSVDLVSLGFRRAGVSPYLWFYIYDGDIHAARGYSPSWKSPDNAPPGTSSLQFEVYSSRHKPLGLSPDGLVEHIVDSVVRMGLAQPNEIVVGHHKRVEFANVVFDLGMEGRRNRVRTYLCEKGVRLAGRFGEWDYFWSDQSLMSGKRAIDGI
jgi:protoporphyrinogen oxidase